MVRSLGNTPPDPKIFEYYGYVEEVEIAFNLSQEHWIDSIQEQLGHPFCYGEVVDAGHPGIIRAINDLQFKDFEDAVQYQSALAAKAIILVTRSEKDFGKSAISVMTPKQVLGQL